MNSKNMFVIVNYFFLILISCGGDSTNLSSKDLKNQLSIMIPGYWDVTSLEVQAQENIGTKVEPLIKSRFKAEICLNSDTYIYEKYIDGFNIISLAAKKGEKREIYGISTAKLFSGNWQIDFEFDNYPISELAKPRDFYSGKEVILKGSAEEDSIMKILQKRQEDINLKMKRAEIAEGDYQTTDTGLKYSILKETDGEKPQSGQTVIVHYSGWLPDGKSFDSSYKRNEPFEFVLGARQVIRGWDEGIALLQKGEKAQLVIPPELGYGQRGIPGVIPPNSTLIFDVELVDFK